MHSFNVHSALGVHIFLMPYGKRTKKEVKKPFQSILHLRRQPIKGQNNQDCIKNAGIPTGIFPTFLRGCKRMVLLQPLIRFCFVFNKPLVFFAKRTLSEGYLRISFTTVFWLL
ncbi:MAG TPA: hypothetical protein DEV98_00275 [Clostridiales bacterium]|nr:hypothetical protein [Clostridiales bacterium]